MTSAHDISASTHTDHRVWRVTGEPLAAPLSGGLLDGETVAVKDLFAVRGFAVGAGLRAFLAEQEPAEHHADAVRSLLLAGAAVTGIAHTDAFAYSITGTSNDYGTPPNLCAPGHIPGGSTSGPSVAVRSGDVSIGLGTDTAGSIRVPAAYQGLWGLRTTHGSVGSTGLLPLAPSFDAVGWITRDGDTLQRVTDAVHDNRRHTEAAPSIVVDRALMAAAEPTIAATVTDLAQAMGARDVDMGLDLDDCLATFNTMQGFEAWRTHGKWIEAHPDALPSDVAKRFENGSNVSEVRYMSARRHAQSVRTMLRSTLKDVTLMLPTTTTGPAAVDAPAEELRQARESTLRLTCMASLGGLPAVTLPAPATPLPVGICLIGGPDTDRDLVRLARRCASHLTTTQEINSHDR